ncbi:dual specificity tyrosine-phosphorylation-regulated kinase 4-like [Thunnus albacares]|uniref:dual specificity tyrosine-phosphorylation-regulated kinase 4-like n=1 Tax=Thunnus albacares TaxID=8236 RepID=UPI001CF6DEB0|nr:dual specificity tyrosine-phosphorylation-regulated kinase 4-like [Thunnus albacares]
MRKHRNRNRSSATSRREEMKRAPVDSKLQPNDVLTSSLSEYLLQHFMFDGFFSRVAQCQDKDTKDTVALKILKEKNNGSQEPNKELAMLKMVRGLDPVNIVRFYEGFEYMGKTCLAFEMLDKNLHQLLKERRGNPLSLQQIRSITQQLVAALRALKTVGVIHTNITPQNIMLVNQKETPFRVKLIDFSSAIKATEVKRGVIMQPVAYRSPEVILGLPISEAADMWSLGGVLATLYLGSLPFPQRCQYYLVKTMVQTLGQPEDQVLDDGTHTLLYFSQNQDSTKPAWRLKTADEHKAVTGFPPQNHSGSTRFSRLDDLVMLYPQAEKIGEKTQFVCLLKQMLCLNPHRRITPSDALSHPFTTMSHEQGDDDDTSSYEMSSPALTSHQEPQDEGGSAAVDIDAISIERDGDSAETESRDEDSDESPSNGRVSDDKAAVTSASTSTAPLPTDLYDAVSADKGPVTTSATDGVSTPPPTDDSDAAASVADEATVTSASTDEASTASPKTGLYDTVSADEGTVTLSAADEVSASPLTADLNNVDSSEETESRSNGRDPDDESPNGATVAADEAIVTSASTNEASTSPVLTDLYDAVSADEGTVTTSATDGVSTPPSTDDSDAAASAADEAAVTSASTNEASTSPVLTDLYDAVSADEGIVTTSATDRALTAPLRDDSDATAGAADEATVTSASIDEASIAPLKTGLYDTVSADKGPVTVSSADKASATLPETDTDEVGPADERTVMDSDGDSATGSRNTRRKPLKRIKRFFGRMFRALCCCCCSVHVEE